jgi:hypothetical protein
MYDCINRPDTSLHPTTTPDHKINPCNAGAIHTGHCEAFSECRWHVDSLSFRKSPTIRSTDFLLAALLFAGPSANAGALIFRDSASG